MLNACDSTLVVVRSRVGETTAEVPQRERHL